MSLHSDMGPRRRCVSQFVFVVFFLLTSPPSGSVQAASGAANGRLVDAARASERETVNYSSKQRSHGVPRVVRASKTNTERVPTADRRSTGKPVWASLPVHFVKRPLPAPLRRPVRGLLSLPGALRSGMRRALPPAAWKEAVV